MRLISAPASGTDICKASLELLFYHFTTGGLSQPTSAPAPTHRYRVSFATASLTLALEPSGSEGLKRVSPDWRLPSEGGGLDVVCVSSGRRHLMACGNILCNPFIQEYSILFRTLLTAGSSAYLVDVTLLQFLQPDLIALYFIYRVYTVA